MAVQEAEVAVDPTRSKAKVETELLKQLNEHQMDVWDALSSIKPTPEKIAMLKILLKVVSNPLKHNNDEKFRQLRFNNAAIKEKILNVDEANSIALLKEAGFMRHIIDNEKRLVLTSLVTIEELTMLSDVWFLIQVKLWYETLDLQNETKFSLPDTLSQGIQSFIQQNPTQSFFTYLQDAGNAGNVVERYEKMGAAIGMIPQFFDKVNTGLDDINTSQTVASFITEQFLSPNKPVSQRKQQSSTDNADEKDEKTQDTNDDTLSTNIEPIRIIDVGCGWCNIGRLLNAIKKEGNAEMDESKYKELKLFGIDASNAMLNIAKKQGFDRHYASVQCHDCKTGGGLSMFEDASIDCIASADCLTQDANIGHPTETFLVECNRVLKSGGYVFIARRCLSLYTRLFSWREIAFQLKWKETHNGRIRESIYIAWKKP